MALGRIAGWLVLAGWALFGVTAAIVASGQSVGPDGAIGTLTWVAAIALIGAGTVLLGLAGAEPLHGRGVRIGLGILGVGLLCAVVAFLIAAGQASDSIALLMALPFLLIGTPAALLGAVITVISLVRSHGRSRSVGLLIVAGALLMAAAGVASKLTTPGTVARDALVIAAALLGCAGVVLGGFGIGVLAIKGGRALPVISA